MALKSTAGTLLLGKYDSPYKLASRYLRDTALDSTSGETLAILNKGLQQNFNSRHNSTLQYHSPLWNGFDFKIGFAPDEAKTSSANKHRFAVQVGYDSDNYHVASAYENRSDTSGTAAATAITLVGGTKLGKKGHLTLGLERFGLNGEHQNNVTLSAKYKLTETFSLSTHLAQAGNEGRKTASKAILFGIGAQYDLSKRSNIAAYFSKISNQNNAQYNFNDNLIDPLASGNDPTVIGVGLNHIF